MTWPWSRPTREVPAYIDTPAGIISADGTRYHTTEPLLRDYAGSVLDAVGLATLVRQAGVWLRTPQTLAVLAFPLLLLVLPWWWAAALALVASFAANGVASAWVAARLPTRTERRTRRRRQCG